MTSAYATSPIAMGQDEAIRRMTMWWDRTLFIPFVESENCDITGPGHQDPAAFAAAVTHYDVTASGDPTCEPTDPIDVSWKWAIVEYDPGFEDEWRVRQVPAGTVGAIPITTIWGSR